MSAHRLSSAAATLVAVLAVVPASAADLIEPWEEGFTNLELQVARGGGDGLGRGAVIGLGLRDSLSLGFTIDTTSEEPANAGLFLMWTRETDRYGTWDLYGELRSSTDEAELAGADRLFGIEWSPRWERPWLPYARFEVAREATVTGVHPLVGVLVPLHRRLGLHVELSALQPEGGAWPLHVAVGPNLLLHPAVEVCPEVSWIRRPGGEDDLETTVTIVVNPRGLARAVR